MLKGAQRLITVALFTFTAHGQDTDSSRGAQDDSKKVESNEGHPYIHLSGGRLLPYGIFGVRDIYPYWGALFGHPFGGTSLEWGFAHIHAKGVTFHTGSISLAFPSELETMKFIPFIGLDIHYYSGKTNLRSLPFSSSGGFHLGVSPIMDISPLVALRADFKLNFNPGQSLHVGGGLQLNF